MRKSTVAFCNDLFELNDVVAAGTERLNEEQCVWTEECLQNQNQNQLDACVSENAKEPQAYGGHQRLEDCGREDAAAREAFERMQVLLLRLVAPHREQIAQLHRAAPLEERAAALLPCVKTRARRKNAERPEEEEEVVVVEDAHRSP